MSKNKLGQSAHKFEGNTTANMALTCALGLRSAERPNWSYCHIWDVGDEAFQQSNTIVQDNRFFSCVGNMVLLPTPLKAFIDVMIEIKMMLRVCSATLYGLTCDDALVSEVAKSVEDWSDWSSNPESWPRPGRKSIPLGTASFSDRVKVVADRRKAKIKQDIANAGVFCPRDDVRAAMNYSGLVL